MKKLLVLVLLLIFVVPAFLNRAREMDTTNKPLLLTRYDPRLGGINCNDDCTTYRNGQPVLDSHYYNYGLTLATAACPEAWLNRRLRIEGIGEFVCRDTGGRIVETSEYIRIDIMSAHQPPCDYIQDVTGDGIKECFAKSWKLN